MKFVIVPGAQIGAIAIQLAQLEAVDPGEKIEAFVKLIGENLDMTQMGEVETGLLGHRIMASGNSSEICGKATSNPSVTIMATQKGMTPAKILPRGTFGAT